MARRLLVVDDDPDIGELVRVVAERVGYEVTVTTKAERFMAMFAEIEPHAVVLDMVMPDVEGTELVKWLADLSFSGQIVLISGYAPIYSEMAKELGDAKGLPPVRTLAKPIDLGELREALS